MRNYDPANPIPNNFYIEEFELNIVDAKKYVNTIIKQRSDDKISLMVNLNNDLFQLHIPRYSLNQKNKKDIVSN